MRGYLGVLERPYNALIEYPSTLDLPPAQFTLLRYNYNPEDRKS